MSSKVYLCDICIILLFSLTIVLADDKPKIVADEGPKGNCSCGGFPTTTPEADTSPILSQSPGLVVKCDEEGANTCMTLCTALATATKAKGPEILCNRLKDADELKLSAFYKTCDQPWIFANMTADEPLCCTDTKVKVCPSMENNTTTSSQTNAHSEVPLPK